MTHKILVGDCLEVLKTMQSESVHSVVTDPPAGIGFMGKTWDGDKGGRDEWIAWLSNVMKESLRVLKPGGHALVWALPRTSHWTATAIENAGFEIRDCVVHVFGTGFPKSLDVSKAIDKAAGVLPIGESEVTFGMTSDKGWNVVNRHLIMPNATTAEAQKWAGWGTALKPASEHWILARKPFVGTVAANVTTHGTGALNIGACRIGDEGGTTRSAQTPVSESGWRTGHEVVELDSGRWPANFVLSEPVDELLGEYARFFYVAKPGRTERDEGLSMMRDMSLSSGEGHALRGERNGESRTGVGKNVHPTVKPIDLMRYFCKLITPPNGIVLDMFSGSGTTGCAAVLEGFEFVGIEQNEEYAKIAEARIVHWSKANEPQNEIVEEYF